MNQFIRYAGMGGETGHAQRQRRMDGRAAALHQEVGRFDRLPQALSNRLSFGGRRFGKHKLIPWLSPGKTWEGLVCGMFTAGLVGAAIARWINPPVYPLPWWKGFIFGVVIGGIGQLGDLLESLMKRDADVKDSGKLVPGFGGVLDIIDSPLLAAPFAYLMFSLF